MHSNWFWAIFCLAAAAWGFSGCAAHAPAPQVEAVGALAAGPSVWTAPLKHDAPPELGAVVETGDVGPAATALDVLRGEAAAVETAPKTDGVTVGDAR